MVNSKFTSKIIKFVGKNWLHILVAFIHLVAILFAKGYGMHDDHFGPIEQPWAIINDTSIWHNRTTPHSHSIFYPFLHFLLFRILYAIGITDPQSIMLVVRLLHSFYFWIGVFFLYKLLNEFYPQHIAKNTILVFSLLWFIPFISVRNLIEFVCIPPITISFWLLCKSKKKTIDFAISGALFGIAFAFRYQTLLISGPVLLVLLFRKEVRNFAFVLIGFILSALLVQGSLDIFAWGYPFASFIEYIRYNLSHSTDYTTGPFYRYIILLIGAFIPPLSIILLYYFVKDHKNKALIVFPVIVFFVFHSIFPNKQERFILPIIPFVFAFGFAEFLSATNYSSLKNLKNSFAKISLIIFWAINIPLLLIFSTNYGKKTRCESLYFLSKQNDVRGVFQIVGKLGSFKPPEFYLNKYKTPIIEIKNLSELKNFENFTAPPNYAIVFGEDIERKQLIEQAEKILNRKFTEIETIRPSLADYILYRLNPKYNKNQTVSICKIE